MGELANLPTVDKLVQEDREYYEAVMYILAYFLARIYIFGGIMPRIIRGFLGSSWIRIRLITVQAGTS